MRPASHSPRVSRCRPATRVDGDAESDGDSLVPGDELGDALGVARSVTSVVRSARLPTIAR